jgi:hypothetical protein
MLGANTRWRMLIAGLLCIGMDSLHEDSKGKVQE